MFSHEPIAVPRAIASPSSFFASMSVPEKTISEWWSADTVTILFTSNYLISIIDVETWIEQLTRRTYNDQFPVIDASARTQAIKNYSNIFCYLKRLGDDIFLKNGEKSLESLVIQRWVFFHDFVWWRIHQAAPPSQGNFVSIRSIKVEQIAIPYNETG